MDSLNRRYLKDTPPITQLDRKLVHRILGELIDEIKPRIIPFDLNKFLLGKVGRLRRRYIKAYNDVIANGFDLLHHSKIAAFVKKERYYKQGKAARMIMGRDPKFNLFYAMVIEPVEKAFFELPQVANACDFHKCGEKFSEMLAEWVLENDMASYEASQREELLGYDYRVYAECSNELCLPRKMVTDLFAAKCLKYGSTSVGVVFKFLFCRGSGDMDTSAGNGLLNYTSTRYNQILNFSPKCAVIKCVDDKCYCRSFVLKGDDSYMKIPINSNPKDYYKNFGFEAKLIIRKSPYEVEFCSGKFIETTPGKFFFAQDLQKLIRSLTTCINDDVVRNGWVAHYYKSLGMMYKKLYKGLPIYDDIANFLLRTCDYGLNMELVNYYSILENFKNCSTTELEFDESLVYLSVSEANSLSIAEVGYIVNWFRSNTLVLPPSMTKRCRSANTKMTEVNVDQQHLLSCYDNSNAFRDKDFRRIHRKLAHIKLRT